MKNQIRHYNVEPTEDVVRFTNDYKFWCDGANEINEAIAARYEEDCDELYEELHQVSKFKREAKLRMYKAQAKACLEVIESIEIPNGKTYIKFIDYNHPFSITNCKGYIVSYLGMIRNFNTESEVKEYLKGWVESQYK